MSDKKINELLDRVLVLPGGTSLLETAVAPAGETLSTYEKVEVLVAAWEEMHREREARVPVQEYCREEVLDREGTSTFQYVRCNAPAETILWGKLFPNEALGPRCWEHAAMHTNRRVHEPGWAMFDLRNLTRGKSGT